MARTVLWIYCDELRADGLFLYGGLRRADTESGRACGERNPLHQRLLLEPGLRAQSHRCPDGIASKLKKFGCATTRRRGMSSSAWVPPTCTEELAVRGIETVNMGKQHLPSGWQVFGRHDPAASGMKEILSGGDRWGTYNSSSHLTYRPGSVGCGQTTVRSRRRRRRSALWRCCRNPPIGHVCYGRASSSSRTRR